MSDKQKTTERKNMLSNTVIGSRQEHLQWCKNRAMEYVNAGDLRQAFASMCSDTMKHPETEMHRATNEMGMEMLMAGMLDTKAEMTKWIQGYN